MGLFLTGFAPQASREYPSPLIREQQTLIVNGVAETWELKWKRAPKPSCGPAQPFAEDSLTCPCMGFAYGETGDLDLVRVRNGAEFDRLHLTPFFQAGSWRPLATLQRWEPDEKDFGVWNEKNFVARVSKRPVVRLIEFADYDHDGSATEFYLQTGSEPCGKRSGFVVGVSARNPRLHVLGIAPNPIKPLYLLKREWDALREANGPFEVLDWECLDHGAEEKTTLFLHWTADGIDGTRRRYSCPEDRSVGRLISEEPLASSQ